MRDDIKPGATLPDFELNVPEVEPATGNALARALAVQ